MKKTISVAWRGATVAPITILHMTPNPSPALPAAAGAPVARFSVLWAPIPGSVYQASNLGMIRHSRTQRILIPSSDRDGYLAVTIVRHGRRCQDYVHRLVLLAFVGQPPSPQHQAAHNDGQRQHNALWNLRWATPKENAADRHRHGTAAVRKLEPAAVEYAAQLYLAGHSYRAIAEKLCVAEETVRRNLHAAGIPSRPPGRPFSKKVSSASRHQRPAQHRQCRNWMPFPAALARAGAIPASIWQ